MNWIVDGKIDLTGSCERAEWHLATAIDILKGEDLSAEDADAYANFAFAENCNDRDAETYLTDAQYDRLDCAN